jgi:hypothetical protein
MGPALAEWVGLEKTERCVSMPLVKLTGLKVTTGVVRARALALAAAVLATGTLASERALACTVAGKPQRVDRVRVQAGARAFEVWLDDQPVEVTASPGVQRFRLRSTGVLEFEGTVPADEVAFFVARPVPLAGGIARIGPDAVLERVRGAPGGVVATVHLPLQGRIERVRLPCGALTLDRQPLEAATDIGRTDWVLDAARAVVYEQPGRGRSVTVMLDHPMWLGLIEERDRWASVRTEALSGWVRRSLLRPKVAGESEGIGWVDVHTRSHGGCSLVGDANTRVEDASVRAGAPVFSAPASERWAVFRADARVQVRFALGSEWAELGFVPGVGVRASGCESTAWVRRADVAPAE